MGLVSLRPQNCLWDFLLAQRGAEMLREAGSAPSTLVCPGGLSTPRPGMRFSHCPETPASCPLRCPSAHLPIRSFSCIFMGSVSLVDTPAGEKLVRRAEPPAPIYPINLRALSLGALSSTPPPFVVLCAWGHAWPPPCSCCLLFSGLAKNVGKLRGGAQEMPPSL